MKKFTLETLGLYGVSNLYKWIRSVGDQPEKMLRCELDVNTNKFTVNLITSTGETMLLKVGNQLIKDESRYLIVE